MTALISAVYFSVMMFALDSSPDAQKYWPQWRGPAANGVALHSNPPLQWSEEKNIKWKIEVPGKGLSSPIVWGDKVFITTAIPTGKSAPQESSDGRGRGIAPSDELDFILLALSRADGKIAWQRKAVTATPHEGTHNDGSWASHSAITDGQHVFAPFGSRGLYCYDMQGKLIWQKDFGDMSTRNGFGEGSSPALHGNTVVVNWDHEGQDFIVALDKRTGKELWKANRDESTSWSTPLVVVHEGKPQVVVSATNRTRSYDLATGKVIWECGGMTLNAIPSPVASDGVVYVTSGFRGSSLQAIRLADAKGDITGTPAIIWKYDQDTPYVPSPLLYGDKIYFLKVNSGILSCFDAKTGKELYGRQRLDGIANIFASPVGAKDRVYLTGRDGTTLVIKHGSAFEVLATNKLDDTIDASAALVENEIYLRGRKFLYCIAEKL